MSRCPFPPTSARRPLTRALLLGTVATALATALVPSAVVAQGRLTCSGPRMSDRHWDRLTTLLARADARGNLVATGPATLVPFRGLERLRDDDFRTEQAVALLETTADQGTLPAGRYCMTAHRTSADPADLASWTVRYYRITDNTAATTPTVSTRGLAYRTSDEDGSEADRPRPAARFHFVRMRGGRMVPTNDGAMFHQVSMVRRQDIEFYSVWYRCGSGCCGASLNF
ncbi:MAG: hypothetical protein ACXW61_00365 [Gemmatirosa sp.]